MIVLLLGCEAELNQDTQMLTFDPFEQGEWDVAADDGHFISRHGIEHDVYMWYPTRQDDSIEDEDKIRYGDFVPGGVWDGGLPQCSTHRPVVMFSHGNMGMSFQSFFLMEHLASHGYIVVAPDHVGNTYLDNDESRKPELIFRRPEDISDAFDWLVNESKLKECVDSNGGYAIVGHSFGGYTALALSGAIIDTEATLNHCDQFGGWLCEHVQTWSNDYGSGLYDRSDQRVWAGIPLTPAAYETLIGGLDNISIAQQVWGGGWDDLTGVSDVIRPSYQALTAEKSMAVVEEAGHYSFTNACQIVSTYPDCEEPFLSTEEVHYLVNGFATSFLAEQRGIKGWEDFVLEKEEHILWE